MFFGGGDPFEHFAGMHGGPGGPGSMRGPPKDVDTTKLYETLGVSPSCVRALSWRKKNAGHVEFVPGSTCERKNAAESQPIDSIWANNPGREEKEERSFGWRATTRLLNPLVLLVALGGLRPTRRYDSSRSHIH